MQVIDLNEQIFMVINFILFHMSGLQPGVMYVVHMYTLNGNTRSPPFTLTQSTGMKLNRLQKRKITCQSALRYANNILIVL